MCLRCRSSEDHGPSQLQQRIGRRGRSRVGLRGWLPGRRRGLSSHRPPAAGSDRRGGYGSGGGRRSRYGSEAPGRPRRHRPGDPDVTVRSSRRIPRPDHDSWVLVDRAGDPRAHAELGLCLGRGGDDHSRGGSRRARLGREDNPELLAQRVHGPEGFRDGGHPGRPGCPAGGHAEDARRIRNDRARDQAARRQPQLAPDDRIDRHRPRHSHEARDGGPAGRGARQGSERRADGQR